jgi:hypothetical protein
MEIRRNGSQPSGTGSAKYFLPVLYALTRIGLSDGRIGALGLKGAMGHYHHDLLPPFSLIFFLPMKETMNFSFWTLRGILSFEG